MKSITCPYDWDCGNEFQTNEMYNSELVLLKTAISEKMTLIFIHCPKCSRMFPFYIVEWNGKAYFAKNPKEININKPKKLEEIKANLNMKIIIIIGPPYSGKGTQCDELVKEYNLTHISTGEHIRKEKEEKSELGKIMSDYDVRGELVPDKIMKRLLKKLIAENINMTGIILDGYPRTIRQINDLDEVLSDRNLSINKIINIEVPTDELLKRAKKRAEASTREDDKNPETHYKRIKIFEEETKPAIEFMKAEFDVNTFDGLGAIEEITERIKACM